MKKNLIIMLLFLSSCNKLNNFKTPTDSNQTENPNTVNENVTIPEKNEIETTKESTEDKSILKEKTNLLDSLINNQSNEDDFFIDNKDAYLQGNWFSSNKISGFHGSDYIYTNPNKNIDSIATWSFNSKNKNIIDIYEKHTAYQNRTASAEFKFLSKNNNLKFYVNQKINHGEWVKIGSLFLDDNEKLSISTYNKFVQNANGGSSDSEVVIADGFKISQNREKIYKASADERSTIEFNCGSDSAYILRGFYYSKNNDSNFCEFSQNDIGFSENKINIGNHICGDPDFGYQKSAIIYYYCKKQ